MSGKSYLGIVSHYEACLSRHGDSHLGVDWASAADAEKRYQVMLDLVTGLADPKREVSLLDFGCGVSHLLTHLRKRNVDNVRYVGLDISPEFLKASGEKYPEIEYLSMDILDDDATLPDFDFIVMNGVFTEKCTLSFNEMFDYFRAVVRKVYPHCRKAMAFNLRSKQVEKEDDDLFHLSLDDCAWFLAGEISRHFTIRQDYGLEEYTVYLYTAPRSAGPYGVGVDAAAAEV